MTTPTGTCDDRSPTLGGAAPMYCLLERGHAGPHRQGAATWGDVPARVHQPTLQQAVDAFGEGVAILLGPIVGMVQDRDEALGVLAESHERLRASHGALLDLLDRIAVRPNWAHDVRTLETARALQDSLEPRPGGPTT